MKLSLPSHSIDPRARRLWVAAAAAVLVTAAIALALLRSVPAQSAAAHATPAAPPPPAVQTARLDHVWVLPQREAPAIVVARNQSRIAAEVSGRVLEWNADVGSQVARGAVLARIDPRDLELAVQRAQAALDAARARAALAQAQQRRSRDLVAQGFLSQEALAQRETEVTLAVAEVSAAQAQLATASHQLEKAVVRAPFAGTVVERGAQAGEAVAPGAVLFVLAEGGAAEVEAQVNPSDVAGLRAASAPVFDALGAEHPLRLLRVSATLTAPARQQPVRLAFASARVAPSGASGTLRWRDSRPHVPPTLMVRRNGALGVFVADPADGGAVVRFVALPGAQEGRASPVNLPGETLLVIGGQAALQDGQTVSSRTAPAATGNGGAAR